MKFQDLRREYKYFALVEKGMRPRTHSEIVRAMQMLCKYAGSEEIETLSRETVRAFLRYGSVERGWHPKTYRIYWQYLRLFFKWCRLEGYVQKNPTDNIEKPKLPKRSPRFLTRDEARKILYHLSWMPWRYELERSRNKAMLSVLLMAGLRANELLNLEALDVNLEEATILVRDGKGNKDRLIPIHSKLLTSLKDYVSQMKRRDKPSRWFFTGVKSEKQLGYKALRRVCERVGKASKIKFTPHMLRHTFGREMRERDIDIFKVKEMMGHENITTTQIYSSVSLNGIKRSLDSVDMY